MSTISINKKNAGGETMLKQLDINCKSFGIILRPKAGNGFWLSALVPFSLMINTWKHPKSVSFEYKLSTIICLGLFLQSIEIFIKLASKKLNHIVNTGTKLLPGAFCAFLVWICLKQDITFSLISGFFTCFIYNGIYIYVLKILPKSFTLGEASIVVQGIVLFLYNAFIQVPYYIQNPPEVEFEEMNAILQVGILGVIVIILLTYFMKFLRKSIAFYFVLLSVALTIIVFPVTRTIPLLVIIKFIFNDVERIFVTIIYVGFLGLTGAVVTWQIRRKTSTSSSVRKLFHILIVVVYIIGLLYQCTYLYIGSGVIFAFLLILELARIIKLYPIYDVLQTAVMAFVDEKDAGYVTLTPIYLLVGCSIPLWLHPCTCDLTDSTVFEFLPLLSGVLSVGVGDMAAGVFGSYFGNHKWSNTMKSIEGTLANIISQLAVIGFLSLMGFLRIYQMNIFIILVGVIANSIIEAKTDQVDNLIVPLVTFIVFSV